ncbi:M48 family metalloprotease [Streptomyces axinellae]|uniref:Peptidase M48 domain-containing protein n=1 Tax=Streptomyces axinellae TaxID=552788 RepID=A0ABN3QFA0_9ACTN
MTPQQDSPYQPPAQADADSHHPHEMTFERRRIHLSAHHRGADVTAWGSLLLHLPHAVFSLVVVFLVSLLFEGLEPFVVGGWLLSGVLVFHKPTESVIARRFLHLRRPTNEERQRLEPVWREVTARAGVDEHGYVLWIEESDELNAMAAAGHIVGVTRYATESIPSGHLAAVLAHELGHHVGGHSWASLLGYWYSLPGRVTATLLRRALKPALRCSLSSVAGALLFLAALCALATVALRSLHGLPLLLLGVPYLLAAVGRRSELRADRHAAGLGFAPMLAEVLSTTGPTEAGKAPRAAFTSRPGSARRSQAGGFAGLLATHPDPHTRLHHLQPYLDRT